MFEHVAVTAMQLQAGVHHPALEFGAPPLRLGGVGGGQLAVVERLDAAVGEGLRDIDLGGHLGQPEPGVLE